jgi:hypothetical protein
VGILIDQNVSARLARLLTGHDAVHASRLGWAELTNGDLLTAAEGDGFELMITADQNIRYQQNLAGRRMAAGTRHEPVGHLIRERRTHPFSHRSHHNRRIFGGRV